MKKLLSTAVLALMYSWAFAATKEIESGANAPVEQVDDVYVILFALLFFGLIIGYFVYLFWGGSKKKKAD